MQVFFCEDDYEAYRRLLREQVRLRRVNILAYCLMPNHIHLVAVPEDRGGLARALAETHRRYALRTNFCHGWRGHLWQERFWSFPMDELSLRAVTRYVLLNPVRAGLVRRAEEWPFSSARFHLQGGGDLLVDGLKQDVKIGDWESLLGGAEEGSSLVTVRSHSANGRPLGSESYISRVETLLGRSVLPRRPGRPRKQP